MPRWGESMGNQFGTGSGFPRPAARQSVQFWQPGIRPHPHLSGHSPDAHQVSVVAVNVYKHYMLLKLAYGAPNRSYLLDVIKVWNNACW